MVKVIEVSDRYAINIVSEPDEADAESAFASVRERPIGYLLYLFSC